MSIGFIFFYLGLILQGIIQYIQRCPLLSHKKYYIDELFSR